MPDVDVNTLDCVVIRGQGNAQASFITSIVLIIFFLCVAAYGLQVSFSSVGVGSVFTPLALTLMMILIMLKTVWGLIQRVPEKLEMAENVRIQVFREGTLRYEYQDIEKIEITRNSSTSKTLYLEITIRGDDAWLFKSKSYSIEALKQFFIQRGFVCHEENKHKMVLHH